MDRIYDFISNSADGVISVDREQRLVLWNSAATQLLGYRAADVLGRRCYEVLRGRDDRGCAVCRQHCNAMETAEHLGLPPTRELEVHTKSDDTIRVNLSSIVVPSRHRVLSVLIHLFREVGPHRELLGTADAFADIVNASSRTFRRLEPPGACVSGDRVLLTSREREVLGHLATGATTQVVSDRLYISPTTVRNHVARILSKLGVHSRLEAVVCSIQHGIL